MPSLKESAIIRKFSTEWEIVQALLDISANTKLTITFTPPPGKAFVFDYSSTGPLTTDTSITYEVFWDGTRAADFTSGGALSDKVFSPGEAPLKIAKNELKVVVDNGTGSAQVIDFLFFGFDIVLSELPELLHDLSGDKDRKIQEDILQTLKNIETKLGVS